MVSRAEVADRSRGPASVVSRTSRSRHHHRNRSHHGGQTQTPLNEFPFFSQSGDVELVIACDGHEKRYLLHRFTLAQFSRFFETNTHEEWPRTQAIIPSRQEQGLSVIGEESSNLSSVHSIQARPISPPRQRWRFELDWENLEEDEDEPILVRKAPEGALFTTSQPPPPPYQAEPQRTPRAQPTHTSFFRSMANLALSSSHGASQSTAQLPVAADPALANPLLRDYDNLFRIFYNYPPLLNATNIASAYSECKALLSLADMYEALPVVGPRIDHHLLRFSSRLFKQIAKYPPSYLKLGYLARSRIIFSEALTHVVGQWPAGLPYIKSPDPNGGGYEVPQSVIDLIEDKVDELEELKLRIETKLFRLTLTTSRGERVNPVNDYLGWLAMSLWRQWLAENTTPEVRGILKNASSTSRPGSAHTNANLSSRGGTGGSAAGAVTLAVQHPPPPLAPVNTGRIFRMIGATNPEAFLPRDELKRFLKIQPPGHSSSSAVYTRDNLRRFERKVDEIKNVARDIVKPLTRNCLELDVRSLSDGQGGGLGYLTCMRCEEEDIPWGP